MVVFVVCSWNFQGWVSIWIFIIGVAFLCSILQRGTWTIDIDPDRWIIFEASGIVKDITQFDHLEYWLWWYKNDSNKYNRRVNNNDAHEVYNVVKAKCVMHIYVKHNVKGMDEVNVGEDVVANDGNNYD